MAQSIVSVRLRLMTIFFVLFAASYRISIAAANATYSAVFAFGDSILDTGNNNNLATMSKCNFPPYGRNFIGGVATGRFGNGKVLSDLISHVFEFRNILQAYGVRNIYPPKLSSLAAAMGVKETLPAYLSPNLQNQDLLTGVSFASGGSGNDDMTANIQGGVLTLSAQLNNFQAYIVKLKALVGEQNASYIISNALFVLSSGNNDIAITYSFTSRRAMPFPSYVSYSAGLALDFLGKLYQLGARHGWVLSTVPLGCLPGARNSVGGPLRLCSDIVTAEAQAFNSELANMVSHSKTNLPDFDLRFIDVHNPMLQIIQNPAASGFVNVANGCCGTGNLEMGPTCNMMTGSCPDPSLYFFWDSGHPSEKAYQLTLNSILQSQKL